MFLPFGWKEFSYSSYEVLVKKTEIMSAPIGDGEFIFIFLKLFSNILNFLSTALKWVWFSTDIDETDLVYAGDHPSGKMYIAR